MSQINSMIKDDFQVVLILSCFVGHPVAIDERLLIYLKSPLQFSAPNRAKIPHISLQFRMNIMSNNSL